MSPVGRDDLGFKIKTISKLLTQNMNNSIMSLDLTSSQALVLGYLCYRTRRQETVYPRDVERHFHFTHPTVSGLLQRLEIKGYLSSEPSPLVAVAVVSAATAVVSVADDMKSFRLRWFERRLRVPRNVEPFSA